MNTHTLLHRSSRWWRTSTKRLKVVVIVVNETESLKKKHFRWKRNNSVIWWVTIINRMTEVVQFNTRDNKEANNQRNQIATGNGWNCNYCLHVDLPLPNWFSLMSIASMFSWFPLQIEYKGLERIFSWS